MGDLLFAYNACSWVMLKQHNIFITYIRRALISQILMMTILYISSWVVVHTGSLRTILDILFGPLNKGDDVFDVCSWYRNHTISSQIRSTSSVQCLHQTDMVDCHCIVCQQRGLAIVQLVSDAHPKKNTSWDFSKIVAMEICGAIANIFERQFDLERQAHKDWTQWPIYFCLLCFDLFPCKGQNNSKVNS